MHKLFDYLAADDTLATIAAIALIFTSGVGFGTIVVTLFWALSA